MIKKSCMKMKITFQLTIIFMFLNSSSNAQSFVEEFINVNSLWTNGWDSINHSTSYGHQPCWRQTGGVYFGNYSGPYTSAIWADYHDIYNAGNINAWLITPPRIMQNGDVIHFYTMSADSLFGNLHPDRLQVRLSINGVSANVGVGDTAVGDFTNLLLDINPHYTTLGFPNGYPGHWHHYILTISGLATPTLGRFAFRYFVEDGGPFGSHGQVIGIDSLAYVSSGDLGINKIKDENKSSAYPNPTFGKIILKDFLFGDEIFVYNMYGNLLLFSKVKEIDLTPFPQGVYHILIKRNDNYFKLEPIIKS
jgi:hypothetical protein